MSEQQTIDDLLAQWEDARGEGKDVSAEELGASLPELLPELKARIEQLKAMDWLDNPDGLEEEMWPPAGKPNSESRAPGNGPGLEVKVPATLGGRYQLESLVAEGGFGQVWRARDKALERPVAIKVTTVDCYGEARRVAQLKHHGIVSVHDVGNQDGLCYIVFDLIEGMTLADRIKQEPLTWPQSARIVAEVAEYVHHAHEKGFIHRDIKPANILLDGKGKPILADFGIAVTECELRREAVTSVGTLAYMSPEQLTLDGAIDARTDIYSLGVVLYELLTGRLPFADRTVTGIRKKILAGGPESPRRLNPSIPPALEGVCLKCLATAPSDRYSTGEELSGELKRLLDSAS